MAWVGALRSAEGTVARRISLAVSAAFPRHKTAGKPARAHDVPVAWSGASAQGCRGNFFGNGKKLIRLRCLFLWFGARKRTRTSTPLREPGPEPGASANSAIRAQQVVNRSNSLCRPHEPLSTQRAKRWRLRLPGQAHSALLLTIK